MDLLIVDVALVSFIVLMISLVVMPERRSTTASAEPVAAAS